MDQNVLIPDRNPPIPDQVAPISDQIVSSSDRMSGILDLTEAIPHQNGGKKDLNAPIRDPATG